MTGAAPGAAATYRRRGRSRTALTTLAAVWLALALLWLAFKAQAGLVAVLALCTLPLVWDILRDSHSHLTLGPEGMDWRGMFGAGRIALDQIDHLRLSRRFDLSLRVTVITRDGLRTRLPPDCVPPAAWLEREAAARGLRTEQHPFALAG